MQSSISLSIAIALLWLAHGPKGRKDMRPNHLQTLVTAMVEFHKNQCYFAGAVQTASVVYSIKKISRGVHTNLINADFIFTTATNGFIPTVFTLTLLSRYGRRSWYLILLTLAVFALSTVSLALSSSVWLKLDPLQKHSRIHDNEVSYSLASCGWATAIDLARSWCGPDNFVLLDGLGFSMRRILLWNL